MFHWTLTFTDAFSLVPERPNEKLTSSEKSIENGENFENLVMQAVDGFLLVLSADGDIIFVSENVSDILGIQQVNINLKFVNFCKIEQNYFCHF